MSEFYEFDGMDDTRIGDLVGHPYCGVHAVPRAGLPAEYARGPLTERADGTAVEPATLEAALIKRADETTATAIRATALAGLRDV